MSRVGQHAVRIPTGVDLQIAGRAITAKGKLGSLSLNLDRDIDVAREEDRLLFSTKSQSKRARAMWGTTARLATNIMKGVTEGFRADLEISGVGFRAAVEGKSLVLQLGYSHEVRHPIPDGITIRCERPTAIAITGSDKQLVGQLAAEIRAYRPPEPYKGKGIKYVNEYILRKEGKKK
jgi:large subunit ribosomal protein L6